MTLTRKWKKKQLYPVSTPLAILTFDFLFKRINFSFYFFLVLEEKTQFSFNAIFAVAVNSSKNWI